MDNQNNTQNANMAMDWNDTINEPEKKYEPLPAGDYNFRITNFERGDFPGSAKLSACKKASLTLYIEAPDGKHAFVYTDILLHRSLEWKISSFFRCIGQKKHGEQLVMDWNTVLGASGRCHIKVTGYVGKDGSDKEKNEVERYIDFDPKYESEKAPWPKPDNAPAGKTESSGYFIPVNDGDELPF